MRLALPFLFLLMAGLAQAQPTATTTENPPPPAAEESSTSSPPTERVGHASGPFSGVGDAARQFGHEVGNGAREVGSAAKRVGTGIGHGARDAAKSVGQGTKDAVHGVGNATRNAVDEAKGTSPPARPAQTQASTPSPTEPAVQQAEPGK